MALCPADHIIGLIYDAPLSGSWTVALSEIERHFKCSHVVLMQHDTARGIQVPIGSDDGLIQARYAEQYAPYNTAWPPLMQHTLGDIGTDAMLLDMPAHRRSMFFNEFLRPNDMEFHSGCVLLRTPTVTDAICFNRPQGMGAFENADLQAIRPLVPHLTRAAQLHRRLRVAESAAHGAWAMLERLPVGVLLVDAHAKLLRANHAAETMLRSADGIALRHGRLVAADTSGSSALQAMIGRRANPYADTLSHGPLRLDRPTGGQPYVVDILPLQGPPGWTGTTRSCCAVFVTDLDRPPNEAAGVLKKMFGLTAAEATLALQIGAGKGLAGIAEQMELGLATVRTHLGHTLNKTGLHRQAELARLVERLAGRLRDEPAD